ncbi:UTP21 [Candida oxycetoniae]|uniref:UTP21 n=1 Tax=Candida oxycetoniae TaxID=497107 RepID=A0AAI9T0S7_9ASCO|nr:UTP21 [Candida oxycetoniae]KAI3406748.2 UTP21 [Candida oxycetoniae]
MVVLSEKKRKVDSVNGSGSGGGGGVAPVRVRKPSKIFSPFRVLGNVTDATPFAIGTLGSTFYAVTSVGKSFQIYDLATLHLLFVSQTQTKSKITCFTTHHHYIFVGSGHKVGIYKRGKLEFTLTCETNGIITHLCHFGEYLIATSSRGELFVFRRTAADGLKFPTELYSVIRAVNIDVDGEIVGVIHPPTYLNKVVVATTSSIVIINVRSGKVLYRSQQQQFGEESLSSIESAPVLDVVGVGTASGNVYIYNLRKGSVLGEKITTSGSETSSKVTSISFRTDGSPHLVAALNNGDLYFHNLNKNTRIHVLRNAHKEAHGGVSKVQFLNGQPILLTNGGDNHLKEFVFDPSLSATNTSIIAPPRHLRSRGGHSAPPVAIQFPDEDKSHFLFSASRDRSFWSFSLRKDAQAQEFSQRMHKSKDGKRQAGQVASLKEKFPEIIAIATSHARTGEWDNILTAHKDEPFARTWDSSTKRVGKHILNTVDQGICKSICISQCGNFGLVGSSLGGIGVYNLQSGLLRRKYLLHKQVVTGLAIDGMNRKMVSCGLDGVVGFYDFGKSKYLGKLQLSAPITSMVYHNQSDLVACALDDLSIIVIDVTTQKVVRVLYGHSNRISGIDFSPNGRWIVSVGLDSTLRTWDLPTGGCIDGVFLPIVATSVKFSPLGDVIATTHVSGNGISLWTNRAQFKPVSTRHVEEEEFSTILLPNASGDGGSIILDGALDEEEEQDTAEFDIGKFVSSDQIDSDLITLSTGPRTKFNTLLYLDTIKQRNKPIEPPKKPEKTPFFIGLTGEAVGDRASVAEGAKEKIIDAKQEQKQEQEEKSKLLQYNFQNRSSGGDGGATTAFESEFTTLLRNSGETSQFEEFNKYLVNLAPSAIDLEIRSLNTQPPLTELTNFIRALLAGLQSNKNFELIETIFSMFLKVHGDVLHQYEDDDTFDLQDILAKFSQVSEEKNEKMDQAIKYLVYTQTLSQSASLSQAPTTTTAAAAAQQTAFEQESSIKSSQGVTIKSVVPQSIRSFRSYQDTRRLFGENHNYTLQNIFKNLTVDNSSIVKLKLLPNDSAAINKKLMLMISPTLVKIYEIVGSHTNLIFSLDEVRCADALYIDHSDKRLLLIGVKRRILVYHVTNKSRNVLQFTLIKEIPLKDKVRTINMYSEDHVIVGVESDYLMMNILSYKLSTFATNDDTDIFSQGASFKYFGLSSSGPLIWTIPTSEDSVLLIKDTTVIQLEKSKSVKISPSPIKLTAVPLNVLFIHPMYLAAIYPKKIEIMEIHNGILIQKFSHYINSNQICCQIEENVLCLASGSDVFQFSIVPLQKQVTQFLSISGKTHFGNARDPNNDLRLVGLENAINLVSDLKPTEENEIFTTEKSKQLRLRELYTLKAISLFESYSKYHESLVDIASEWLISYHDVLSLFPDFLNGEYLLSKKSVDAQGKVAEEEQIRSPHSSSAVKRITKEDLESNPISESDYETDNTARKYTAATLSSTTTTATTGTTATTATTKNNVKSQSIRKFTKAVNNLIIYLTEQRRILLSFFDKSAINWKHVLLEPNDIYPPIDNQLIKVSTIIDTSLFLCYFYVKPMLLGPLLRLPNNKCDSKIVNECLMSNIHNHAQQRNFKQPNYIKELLDFYYGRNLHREALEMLYKLAHGDEQSKVVHSNEEDNAYDDFIKGPGLTVRYLSKLTNDNLDLILEYAKWAISANEENSKILFMNDSDLIAKLKNNKQFGRFETKLCILYLRQIKEQDGSPKEDEYYSNLKNLLSTSETFDPWPILKEIPTNEDKFLRLTVFVYRKLQEHEKAVDVLFNQLNDLDEAILYCLAIYKQPNGTTIGRGLFHKLLGDLLINYVENIDLISKLLSEQGLKMSVDFVFDILPASFPLYKIANYLKQQVAAVKNKVDDTRINSQLYKVGSINLKDKIIKLQDDSYKINSSKTLCPVCREKLGYSILTVTDDSDIVHYGCAQRLRKQQQ